MSTSKIKFIKHRINPRITQKHGGMFGKVRKFKDKDDEEKINDEIKHVMLTYFNKNIKPFNIFQKKFTIKDHRTSLDHKVYFRLIKNYKDIHYRYEFARFDDKDNKLVFYSIEDNRYYDVINTDEYYFYDYKNFNTYYKNIINYNINDGDEVKILYFKDDALIGNTITIKNHPQHYNVAEFTYNDKKIEIYKDQVALPLNNVNITIEQGQEVSCIINNFKIVDNSTKQMSYTHIIDNNIIFGIYKIDNKKNNILLSYVNNNVTKTENIQKNKGTTSNITYTYKSKPYSKDALDLTTTHRDLDFMDNLSIITIDFDIFKDNFKLEMPRFKVGDTVTTQCFSGFDIRGSKQNNNKSGIIEEILQYGYFKILLNRISNDKTLKYVYFNHNCLTYNPPTVVKQPIVSDKIQSNPEINKKFLVVVNYNKKDGTSTAEAQNKLYQITDINKVAQLDTLDYLQIVENNTNITTPIPLVKATPNNEGNNKINNYLAVSSVPVSSVPVSSVPVSSVPVSPEIVAASTIASISSSSPTKQYTKPPRSKTSRINMTGNEILKERNQQISLAASEIQNGNDSRSVTPPRSHVSYTKP